MNISKSRMIHVESLKQGDKFMNANGEKYVFECSQKMSGKNLSTGKSKCFIEGTLVIPSK